MAWKNFLVSALLLLSSCKTPNAPEWHGKLWSATADRVGIERTQDNEFISASDERFSDYFCVNSADLAELIKNFDKCKKWEE